MVCFQASLVRFTLIVEKFCSTPKFLLLELLKFNIFCMSLFSPRVYNRKQFCSKIQNFTRGKFVTMYKNAYFNFSLIRLHKRSSPQFIRLNGTKCRLSKVIVHFTKYFRLLVDPRGTRKAMFFCRSATRTFLRICRVVIYRNVAMLQKPS